MIELETEDGIRTWDSEFEEHYSPHKWKTFLAALFLMFSMFLNALCLTAIQPLLPEWPPLPDLVHMILRQHHWAWAVSDTMISIHVVAGFGVILLHKYRSAVFRRIFLIMGILYFLRVCCLAVSFLPSSFRNSDKICFRENYKDVGDFLRVLFTYIPTMGKGADEDRVLCGDLIYSGHTIVISVAYFTICRYTPEGVSVFRWSMTPVSYFGIFTVLISGAHYTIDVFISYWLSSHVFWAYHQFFETPAPFDGDESNCGSTNKSPMRNIWWVWMVGWFEPGLSRTPIPNELSWPCCWPQCMVMLINKLSERWSSG